MNCWCCVRLKKGVCTRHGYRHIAPQCCCCCCCYCPYKLPQTRSSCCIPVPLQLPLPDGVPVSVSVLLARHAYLGHRPSPATLPPSQQNPPPTAPGSCPDNTAASPPAAAAPAAAGGSDGHTAFAAGRMAKGEGELIGVQGQTESSAQSGRERRVLHVQSISSWAPSCIGPYSQVSSTGCMALRDEVCCLMGKWQPWKEELKDMGSSDRGVGVRLGLSDRGLGLFSLVVRHSGAEAMLVSSVPLPLISAPKTWLELTRRGGEWLGFKVKVTHLLQYLTRFLNLAAAIKWAGTELQAHEKRELTWVNLAGWHVTMLAPSST
eukprot:1159148-Pelagomonas_calceolata.AAC.21